jgi:glycerophosphoryl diester phosphodiesterase
MPERKLVVAHRGDRSRAPENTIEAFQHAIDCGADMIETDVRRTDTGELVLRHDELAGCNTDALPRLRDLLDLARGRVQLDIELKETGYEAEVLREIAGAGFAIDALVVTSFERAAIDSVRSARPDIRTGILVYEVTGGEALRIFRDSNADFLGPDYTILDNEMLIRACDSGVPLLPWTVNDPAAIRTLLEARCVIGIITDDPGAAMAIRR